jgi:hypothetical protein
MHGSALLPGSGMLRLGFRGAGRRGRREGEGSGLPGKMGARGWDTGVLRPQDLDPKAEVR